MSIFSLDPQERRRALDELNAQIGESLRYYLGPTPIPQLLGFAAEMTPSRTVERASEASRRVAAPELTPMQRIAAGGEALGETAAVAFPLAAGARGALPMSEAVQEALMGVSIPARAVGQAVAERATQPGPMPRTLYSNPLMRAEEEAAGIRAYHGSPYTFERFDVSKIGTGEGAQSYGHGLYFAEAEDVARGYRDALSEAPGIRGILPEGQVFNDPSISTDQRLPTAQGVVLEKVFDRFQENVARQGLSRDAIASAIDGAEQEIKNRLIQRIRDNPIDRRTEIYERGFDRTEQAYSSQLDYIASLRSRIDELEPVAGSGRVYEVRIDADPEDFLDWDRPLSEQPNVFSRLQIPQIRRYSDIFEEANSLMREGDALAGRKNGWMDNPDIVSRVEALQKELSQTTPDMSVRDLMMRVGSDIPNPQGFNSDRAMVRASEVFREAGIPGIKYFDAMSRGAGEGSRNYVVFDDRLISIVRMYGIGGAAALLGVTAADVEQALAENLPPSEWESLVVGPQ